MHHEDARLIWVLSYMWHHWTINRLARECPELGYLAVIHTLPCDRVFSKVILGVISSNPAG